MELVVFLGASAFAALAGAAFVPDWPPATQTIDFLVERQATTAIPTPGSSTTYASIDPWQCVTENITQHFDGPTPTGDVLTAINSYGHELAKPCMATATGLDMLSCVVADSKAWCGFTTAAPSTVLSSYSTYVSSAVSFWTAKSATMSILSTSCAVAWALPDPAQRAWLSIGSCHAQCYLQAHPQTTTGSSSTSTPTSISATPANLTTSSTAPTTTSKASKASTQPHGRDLEALALMSTGLAILANAM
jgi:hypothetical protein